MNNDFDHGLDSGDRPLAIVPRERTRTVLVRARASLSGRVFRWWLAISLLLVLGLVVCVSFGLDQIDLSQVHVYIGGDDLGNIRVDGLHGDGLALAQAGMVLVALLVLMLLPLVLALVLSCVAIALLCAVGVPLIAVGIALAAVTSPLWLVGLLVWLVVRRRHPPSATITA